jgi:hypothetical protein
MYIFIQIYLNIFYIYIINIFLRNRAAWNQVALSTIYKAGATGVLRYIISIIITKLNYMSFLIKNLNLPGDFVYF